VNDFTPRDFCTIIAALRCYQACIDGRPHVHQDLDDMATNAGECAALTSEEIDTLIDRLLLPEPVAQLEESHGRD
jgi:hypothetical protein